MQRVKLCPGRVDILPYFFWMIGIPGKINKKTNRSVIKAYDAQRSKRAFNVADII